MAGKWTALNKEHIYVADIEEAFDSFDKCRLLDLRKSLLVEKENISRQLALAKFKKNASKVAAKNDLKKDSEEMEEKLQERLDEVTAKLRTECDIAYAEKVEAATARNTFCERLPSKNSFDSFLVQGVGLSIPSHTGINSTSPAEKKEKESSLNKLLPPIKLPPLHCQKRGRSLFQERRQRKQDDETGNIWEDLLECRYLRLYRPKEKGKQK